MIDKELIWFNQKYLNHKDTEFSNDDSSLELSISLNTSDYQTYSTPTFNFSIFNHKVRYNINFRYQDIVELLESIDEISKNITTIYNNGGSEIRKICNNKNLKIGFKVSQKTGKKAVVIIIANSTNDFGVIVLTYNFFLIIVELMKSFKDNYIRLPFEISNRMISNLILDELKEIKEFNKSLPSSIVDMTKISTPFSSDDNIPPWDMDKGFRNEEQEKFDEFISNSNLDEVKIPILDKLSNTVEEYHDNFFISDILKNDINNLEPFIVSLTVNDNPINKFKEIISNYISDGLPFISDDEFKSICYYSKRFFLYNIQNCTKNNLQIPTSIPIIKYKANDFNDKNIELAYDLLTVSIYIRLVKDKLLAKVQDVSVNKSILYLSLRNYTDVFTFSFLDSIDPDMIVKCVNDRFQRYSKIGFFKSYDDILNQYNIDKINEIEINNFTNQVVNKVVGLNKTLDIVELHKKDYSDGKVKLPFTNDLSTDMIVNEFVKAEIELKFEIINMSGYNKDVIDILYEKEKEDIQDESKIDVDQDWASSLNLE